MHTVAITLLVLGVCLAITALPSVRRRASEHIDQLKDIVHGAPIASPQSAAPVQTEITTPVANRRREIEDFDLSLFE